MVVNYLYREFLELIKAISSMLDEHTQILRALEYLIKTHKSEEKSLIFERI